MFWAAVRPIGSSRSRDVVVPPPYIAFMIKKDSVPAAPASQNEVDAFLRQVATTPRPHDRSGTSGRGRLVFAMDATASRQPSWDRACQIQGEMFAATADLGGLSIQLVYYRSFDECKASGWTDDPRALLRKMTAVTCLGGRTQIARVLRHTLKQTEKSPVNALVFVGDCMEEDPDELCHLAGELGLHRVPLFLFHEGGQQQAATTFRQMARLTRGAYCPFDASSAEQLKQLLTAVAVYAAGGRAALERYGAGGDSVRLLTRQLGENA